MRVALCLFGHLRSFDRCFNNLKTNVLDPLGPDVFAHAWTDSMGLWLPRSSIRTDPKVNPGYRTDSPPPSPEYIRAVLDQLRPVDVHLDHYYIHDERFQELTDRLKQFWSWESTNTPKSTFSMTWCREVAIAMKRRRELLQGWNYDQVICTRWDINHTKKIDLTENDPNILTFVKGGGDHPGDTWASGPSHLMDLWGDQYKGMSELIANNTMDTGPHEWQTAWFNLKQIPWINRTDIGADVLR